MRLYQVNLMRVGKNPEGCLVASWDDRSSRGLNQLHMTELKLVTSEPGQSRYAALASVLKGRIVAGEWPPGSALPAEQMLAAEHGVALGTLRRALELLAEQGMIERLHGRGTFVKAGMAGATMMRFFRFGEGTGEVPVSRIASRQVLTAPAEVARRLGLGRGDDALRLHRVRLFSGQPCVLEEIWLKLQAFGALVDLPISDWGNLLYPMYAEKFGVHVHRVMDEISFSLLTAPQARYLDLPAGHPCALVTRNAYDLTGNCIEVRFTRGDAHAFHYSVSIT